MRRPLFWVSLFLSIVAFWNFWHGGGFARSGWDPPDTEERIVLCGRVTGKETGNEKEYFLLQVDFSKSYQMAASSQQTISQIIFWMNHKKCTKLQCFPTMEHGEALPKIGSIVIISGKPEGFPEATNPGEFDLERYYRSRSIAGKLTETVILNTEKEGSFLWEGLYQLRHLLGERLQRGLPEKEAGVMKTMLLGDRTDLDKDLKEVYRDGGILHILSISGLHITLLGMGLYRILRRSGVPEGVACTGAGAVLFLYGGMTGMSVSAVRAIGMFLLRMLSVIWGHTYDMLTALGVLGATLVCVKPVYFLNSGFWLSFGALYGVGCILPALERLQWEEKQGEKGASLTERLGEAMRGGLAVTLAELPLQLWFYYEVPVYSMLINLLVLPAMTVVITGGCLVMLLPGCVPAKWVTILLLRGFEQLCNAVQMLPLHTWNPGCPSIGQILGYYLVLSGGLAGLCRYQERREREREPGTPIGYRKRKEAERGPEPSEECPEVQNKWRRAKWEKRGWYLAKCLAVGLPVLLLGWNFHPGDGVVFLDVGQGDCVCIRSGSGKAWISDCGSTDKSKVGEKILIPWLKYEGIREIEGVFLSHLDKDHVSGLEELFAKAEEEGIRIRRLLLPDLGEDGREEFGELIRAAEKLEEPCELFFLAAGDRLEGRNLLLEVLNPGAPREKGQKKAQAVERNRNAESLCLFAELRHKEQRLGMLLTGDVEGEGEEKLIAQLKERNPKDIQVLKCAHHGSRNSTAEELLEQLDLQLTVISCGRNNRYGHPHQELLERLIQEGCGILRTDREGAVEIRYRSGNYMAESWRKRRG